jgi:neopullulanase
MKKNILLFILTYFVHITCWSQELNVYPTHWWTKMKNQVLQLMIHGEQDISSSITVNYPGVSIQRIHQPENKHYCFVDLKISPSAAAGTVNIKVGNKILAYKLKARNGGNGSSRVKGVNSSDFIYLIMPDRFANGDPSNDKFDDLKDPVSDRNNPWARHGGDIKGVIDHLEYLSDLGVTSIWMTPVLENNMPQMLEGSRMMSGYHGYWITNHYRVDKRFGGNEAYHQLVETAHAKGMKIVQDAVYNHVGAHHHTVLDLPFKDWLNQWPSYQGSNHREEVFFDPYGADVDKKIMVGGWFVPHLPDLNLANEYVANYVIQNTIWSTEEFGIDGWRVDTYKYCDEKFLNKINDALTKEFPSITVFGEAWANSITGSAYFANNNTNFIFDHNTQGVTDFPFCFAMQAAVNQPFGWTEGASRLYMTLAQDRLYKNPMRNCIFLDNHDMDRFYSVVGENLPKFKMGMALLLTQRGIPQLYYGTEILMKNFKNPTDAEVRKDYPGGWPGDTENKFISSGRNQQENEAFNYVKTFSQFRKNSSALKTGKLMQYLPQNGVYVYFRYDNNQTVMCVLNTNDNASSIELSRFSERIGNYTKALDVATGTTFNLEPTLTLGPKYLLVMKLQ